MNHLDKFAKDQFYNDLNGEVIEGKDYQDTGTIWQALDMKNEKDPTKKTAKGIKTSTINNDIWPLQTVFAWRRVLDGSNESSLELRPSTLYGKDE